MKQNILQKLAMLLVLCFFFQNAQAQLDDGKFPDKLRPPMIDNIVIFNSSLTDYIVNVQSTQYSMSDIVGESDNYNPSQNNNTITATNETEVQYANISKDLLVNSLEQATTVIEEEEDMATTPNIGHQQHYGDFNVGVLADLVSAYPNPVQNMLIVEMKGNLPLDICLVNMLGQVVHHTNSSQTGKVYLDMMDFAEGTYILDIRSETERSSQKIQIVR